MSDNQTPRDSERISRIVDVRIPLWGLLTALTTAAYFLISMYFTTIQTAQNVSELQITVKAGNTQVTTLAGEQALLRFRMENIEGEIRSLKGGAFSVPPANAQRRP